jgi:hypothetical protein
VNGTETVVPVPLSVTVPTVGACGTVVAVIEELAPEEELVAEAFVPVTAKV